MGNLGIAAICTTLGAPVAAVAALIIRLDSPGPVIFRQQRVGLDGTPFDMFKFRTMYDHTEEVAVFSTIDDERVTRVGNWLRRTRIDELPQLLNVLRGDMNLVGPRPERPGFVAEFAQTVPGYESRHAVLPGITGLAQIQLGYAASAGDKLVLDLAYIESASLIGDLKILWNTISSIGRLSAEGVDPNDPRATGPITSVSGTSTPSTSLPGESTLASLEPASLEPVEGAE